MMTIKTRVPSVAAMCFLAVLCAVSFGCKTETDDTEKDDGDSAILSSLSVEKAPDKCIYSCGETLDLTGIKVRGTYSDGSVADVSVTNADCSGFTSETYDSSVPVTITVSGQSASFTVRIIGDLVGRWGDGTTVKYTLNSDLTGDTEHIRGGTWSVKGDTLTMTFTETYNAPTGWSVSSYDPSIQQWGIIVIDGKLRVSVPFLRIGSGSTLEGIWEQIAWFPDGNKIRLTVAADGNATYSIIPVVSFNRLTGEGTWNYDSVTPVLSCKVSLPFPAVIPGTSTTVTVSDSTDMSIAPNGNHPVTFFTVNKMDLDAEAWIRMIP